MGDPDGPWLERMLRDLHAEGSGVAALSGAAGWRIEHHRGDDGSPPVVLVATEDELVALLDAMADDALEVFPDVGGRLAAYRLLLVHLDEVIDTEAVPGSQLRFDGALSVAPVRGRPAPPDVQAPGDLRWTAERPS